MKKAINIPAETTQYTSVSTDPKQLSLPILLLMHLIPGACIGLFYLLVAPWATHVGFPAQIALLLAFLCVNIPFEMGYLFALGKRRNGTFSLRGIVLYTQQMPRWQYAAFLIPFLIYAIAMLIVLLPVNSFLTVRVFNWLPAYMLPQVGKQALTAATLITALLTLVLDGIVNPIVEEMYFRGYLLPRLTRLGWLAPVVNTLLFTLGHIWQPYNYPFIFLTVLPMVLVVFWKRNIRFSMLTHYTANTLGAVLTLIALLAVR